MTTKRGGRLSVCLVYPNTYGVAMGNLGVQAVHSLFNSHKGVVCERAFLPDAKELREYQKSHRPLLSLESQRPVAEFDVIAFSVSFESDYMNIPRIFQLAGIPPFSCERGTATPLVMAGGAALTLNPEPVADFMDMVCIGEGEAIIPSLLGLLESCCISERSVFLRKAATIPGVYVPSFYDFTYENARVASIDIREAAPSHVKRVWVQDLDDSAAVSRILAAEGEFSDMYLIEISRGCPHGCRFCAAGFMYLPYRQRSLEAVKLQVAEGLRYRHRIGLVGAAVSDFRKIGELSSHILDCGGKVSVSSLRVDGLDDRVIEVLKSSGHKTIALAPEGGSQRLRNLVGKKIDQEQILSACDRLIRQDILNLKLYFIIGLPTETMADLEEMVELVKRIRDKVISAAKEKGRLGEVLLSVNPFVPKPSTPFQWCGMENVKVLEEKAAFLHDAFRPLSNVRMKMESLRDAYVQALISRGDRRLGPFMMMANELGSWKRAAKALGLDTDGLVYRNIDPGELLPWDVIDNGAGQRLLQEYTDVFSSSGEKKEISQTCV